MKICIDPGHSGPLEPGACAGGFSEATLVMAISRFLQQELQQRGHAVLLTRDGPAADDELAWRATLSNDWGADLFLCIHCNSAVRIEAEGTEVYHYPGSEAGERLARAIQFRICDALLTEDRGVKQADFQVLRETVCPAVLIECGFISNPIDRGMLTDPLEQWRLGAAIAVAVDDWQKNTEEN
jgi:N-acetylmuramoyl-L-alanine amidase